MGLADIVGLAGWLVCLVGSVLGFSAITQRETSSLSLPAALAVGACAVVPDVVGRVAGSLVPGLVLLGALGWAVFGLTRRRPQTALGVAPNVGALVVLAGVVGVVVTFGLHDRIMHIAFTGAAARGVLPLQHPFFPGPPLNYHVGFDVFAAGLVELGRLSPRTAVAVAAAIVVALMLLTLKELLPQSRFIWLLPLLAHGPLAVCTAAIPGGVCGAFDAGFAAAQASVPPPISSLLQPPQGFGLVLAFALLQLAGTRTARGGVLLGLGCAFLAQVHLVVFLVAGCGVAAATAFEALQSRDARVLRRLLGPLGAFAAWLAFGSFPASTSSMLAVGGFFGDRAAAGIFVFFPAAIGAVLLVGLRLLRGTAQPLDVGLASSGIAGLAVFMLFHYEKSWDIVKFATVSCWFLSLALARNIGYLPRRALASIAIILGLSSMFWIISTLVQPQNPKRLEAAGEQFLARFGDEIAGSDCVATRATAISAAGVLTVGGPLSLGDDLVFDRDQMARRLDAFDRFDRDGDRAALADIGCRYLFRPTDQVIGGGALQAVGNMMVGSAHWTLYRVSEQPTQERR